MARLYREVATDFVLDAVDADLGARRGGRSACATLVTDTIMTDDAARARLAGEVLRFAATAAYHPVVQRESDR